MKVRERVSCFGWVLLGLACTDSIGEIGSVEQSVAPPRPDLVVTSVTGPVTANGPFVGTAEVCNRGTANSLPTTINIYLSRDKRIEGITTTGLDPYAGSFDVIGLFPGQCRSLEGPLSVTVPADGRYVIAGIVDEANTQAEPNERNNTFIGGFVPAGVRAELFVESVRTPSFVGFFGQPMPVEVRVCNQGTIPARASTVGLYASDDTTITTTLPDVLLATIPTPPLAIGECFDHRGTYGWTTAASVTYLGAIVDPRKREPELEETNNATASGPIQVGSIDLEVAELRFSEPGDPFWAQVRVCNRGNFIIGGNVEIYGSADALVVPPNQDPTSQDLRLGTHFGSGILEPMTCEELSLLDAPAAVYSTEIRFLGVFAFPDENPSNNQQVAALPVIPQDFQWLRSPNFHVKEVTARLVPGGIEATARICQTSEFLPNVRAQFYVSDDRRLDLGVAWADRDGGSVTLLGGSPSRECYDLTHTIPGAAPETAFVAVRVDPNNLIDEQLETDNEGWSGPVYATPRPNLVVRSAELPAIAADPILAEVVVCNEGAGVSAPTTVGVYLSHERNLEVFGVPAASDLRVGSELVPELAAGECLTRRGSFPRPSGTGTWRWRTVVDPDRAILESDEGDNHLDGGWVGLGFGPDLVVQDFELTGPLQWGATTARVAVCNLGDQPSAATSVNWYAVRDEEFDPRAFGRGPSESQPMYPVPVPSISAGRCVWINVPWYSGPLIRYGRLAAWVNEDGLAPERTTRNNGLLGPAMTGGLADFVARILSVPEFSYFSPVGPRPVVRAEVCNRGGYSQAGLSLSAVRQPQTPPDASSPYLGNTGTMYLQAGACEVVDFEISASLPSGLSYLWLEAYGPPEADTRNNVAVAPRPYGLGTDLVVAAVQAQPSGRGDFDVSVQVCNRGVDPAAPSILEIRLSEDRLPNVGSAGGPDPILVTRSLPQVGDHSCVWSHGSVQPPPGSPQSAHFLARLIPGGPDLSTVEDLGFSDPITTGPGVDLTVSSLALRSVFSNMYRAELRVCNQGQSAAPASEVSFLISTDAALDLPGGYWPEDLRSGQVAIPPLPALGCASFVHTIFSEPGPAPTVFAVVDLDRLVPEIDEANNHAAHRFTPLPDLVVEGLNVLARSGSTVQVSVRACNRGFSFSGPTQVRVRASSELFVADGSPQVGQVSVPSMPQHSCTVAYGQVTVPVGQLRRLAGTIDEVRQIPELDDNNNTFLGDLLPVSEAPGLSVVEAGLPDLLSTAAGPMELRVCNSGWEAADAYPAIWASSSREFSTAGAFVGAGGPYLPFLSYSPAMVWPESCRTISADPGGFPTLQGDWFLTSTLFEFWHEAPYRIEPLGIRTFGSGPDLRVTRFERVGPDLLEAEVCNAGNLVAPAANLSLRAAADRDLDPRQAPPSGEWSTTSIPSLAVGSCTVVTSPLPDLANNLALAAVLDDPASRGELVVHNNALRGPNLGLAPDLRVRALGFPPPYQTSTIHPVLEVCNDGAQASPPTSVSLYASLDQVFDGFGQAQDGDFYLDELNVPGLAGGSCIELETTLSAPYLSLFSPTPGQPEYLWVIVDSQGIVEEFDERNNTALSGPLVYGSGPDLVIEAIDAPPVMTPWALSGTARVCNRGQATSGVTEVSLAAVLEEPALGWDFDDWENLRLPLGEGTVGALGPGACQTVAVAPSGPLPEYRFGAYRLVGRVDRSAVVVESDEGNNRQSAGRVIISEGPDSYVQAASLRVGEFDAVVTATVCNQGTIADDYPPRLILSLDQAVDGSDYFGDQLLSPQGLTPAGECRVMSTRITSWSPSLNPTWPPSQPLWLAVSSYGDFDVDPSNDTFWIGQYSGP